MRLIMFKRIKPRGFNYKPIHYDPVQEAREERRKELLGADAASPLQKEGVEREYEPGQYIRSMGIRRSRSGISSRLAEKRRASGMRSLLTLAILGVLALWLLVGPRAALMGLLATGVAAVYMVMRNNRNRSNR